MFVTHGETKVEISLDNEVATPRIIKEIESGGYEQREVLFARRVVKENDRVLELGAGLGFVSAAVCSEVVPKHYTAVEADERLIPHIRRTHEKNNIRNVKVLRGAFVSSREDVERGYVEFGVSKAFWGSGIDKAGEENTTLVKVPTFDISEFIRKKRISVLISDIEGGELEILRHLDFGPLKRVIMELHPKVFGLEGMREIFQILDRNNFVYNARNSHGPVVTFVRI